MKTNDSLVKRLGLGAAATAVGLTSLTGCIPTQPEPVRRIKVIDKVMIEDYKGNERAHSASCTFFVPYNLSVEEFRRNSQEYLSKASYSVTPTSRALSSKDNSLSDYRERSICSELGSKIKTEKYYYLLQ